MCGGGKFKTVIDMGKTPLVNSLIEKEDLGKVEKTFPLVVRQCQDCSLVQLTETRDSNEIYKDVDYLYFSGDMPKLAEYFQEYANDLKERFLEAGDFVVEMGSNDGLMLKMFTLYKTLGVDPATNTVVRALANGVPTISDFFTYRLARSIVRDWGKAKLIFANNCIAHTANLNDIFEGFNLLLRDDGVIVIECNYWGGMVKNKNYSLIYHDHFSYFSLKKWMDYVPKFGMNVFDAIVTPAQGGSLRLFIDKGIRTKSQRMEELYNEEITTQLSSYETCKKYDYECHEEAEKLGSLIYSLKDEGSSIAGYGAAAKGFSILQLAGITENHLDYFVDDSPAKQGKYTPITHIPVISRAEAQGKLPDYFFITAPNYSQVIVDKEQPFRDNGGKFITSDSRVI